MYTLRIKRIVNLLMQTSEFLSDHKVELENDISSNVYSDGRCTIGMQNYILIRLETLSKDIRHDVNILSAIIDEMGNGPICFDCECKIEDEIIADGIWEKEKQFLNSGDADR